MALYNGFLYKGEVQTMVLNGLGTIAKIKANIPSGSSVTYMVKGRLTPDGEDTGIALINDSTLSTNGSGVTDNAVYTCDVSGYYSITADVTASGNAEVYVSVLE